MNDRLIDDFCTDVIYLSETERIKLLDTEKYYDMFMVECLIKNIRLTYYMTIRIINHVIYTRKIQPIYYDFFTNVMFLFGSIDDIKKIFSRYTETEIINIITYDISPGTNISINGTSYVNTILLYIIIPCNNILLIDYMLSYLIRYDIDLSQANLHNSCLHYSIPSSDRRAPYITRLNEHNDNMNIYKYSLRNTWISSCIF